MVVNHEPNESTEYSPLLQNHDHKTAQSQLYGSSSTSSAEATLTDNESQTPLATNPLMEGMPEVAARLHFLLPAVGIGIFLSAADQTIIVSSYGRIGSELHALNSTSWIATAYFLTLTSFQPLYGKLSDIFGRKPCLLFAYVIFGIGCLACGLARSMPELIAARAFAGIGGGGMTTVVSIMMSDIIPLRERGTWQGYINLIYAAGAASGAPLGGIFSDVIGWRWAFLIQAPMCLLAFIAVFFVLDLPKIEKTHWKEKLAKVDFFGSFCLILAISSLLFGLDHGSNYAWNNKWTIITLALAAPFTILFCIVESKVEHPFAPLSIIGNRNLTPAYLCNAFAFGGYLSTIFYIPLYFQAVDGISATQAGLRLIPGIIGSVTGSVGGGLIMQKTGKYYILTVIAYSLLFLGQVPILLSTGLVWSSTGGIIFGLVLSGLGGGIGVTSSLIALIANADPKDQAIATACSYLFRSLGSVVGVSLSSTLVQQLLRSNLANRLGNGDEADRIVDGVRQSLDFIKDLEPSVRDIVIKSYQISTRGAFAFSALVVSGAVISACFIKEKPLGAKK